MLVIVLVGCKTIDTKIEYHIPSLTAFRPSMAPVGLLEFPKTDKDLMHNLVTFEFWAYEWQDYGLASEELIETLK